MIIRELLKEDLSKLLELHTQLKNSDLPVIDDGLKALWDKILSCKDHHVVGGFVEEELVSSCVMVIIPNLTHNQRPYALIENVITDRAHRNKGYATSVLNFARDMARKENCYKIMLMTGSKEEGTIKFYENAGYNQNDKTAFVQWMM